MKRFLSIAMLFCGLVLSVRLWSQAPAPQPAAPVVVTVSFNAAVLQTAEAQRELSTLQTKYAPRQNQLKTLNDEIEALRKQLEATGDKLSDAERTSREQSFNTKQKQLQRDSEDYRTDTQADQQQVFEKAAQKLYAFLQTYAQQHGYALVVERGSDSAPVVWYAAGNLDITADLIKAYNAQSGSTTPAAGTKPGAAGAQKPQ